MIEIVNIDENEFAVSLKVYENNQISGDYPCIVFSLGENNPCENWSLQMKPILPILCEKIINMIITNIPEKFCFYTKDDEIYDYYKSMEIPYISNNQVIYNNIKYNVREQSLNIPGINIKVSFYDKVN